MGDRRAGSTGPLATRRPRHRRARTSRRRRPGLPLVAGIAVLAVCAGGALQVMQAGVGRASAHALAPATTLSVSRSVDSTSLVGGRPMIVSRSADRLSEIRAKAQKRAKEVRLHQWVLPVRRGDYTLTARFGDYSALWSHFHTGLDFAAPTGTPIMAVAGGTITKVGYTGAYGDRTVERLANGTKLWYCHQNAFATHVGAEVRPGQVIGHVGSTGNVTGPHLHLEVHPHGGHAVDPYAALVQHGLRPGRP